MKKKKIQKPRKPRVSGLAGPYADFNHDTLLDRIVARAKDQSRPAALARILTDAGFTDVPPANIWRQWYYRRKISDAWMPTVLYALLVSGEKIAPRDLLKVIEE